MTSSNKRRDAAFDPARRRALADMAKYVSGAGVAGVALAGFAVQSKTLPAEALRPPGAIGEGEFQSACVRCGLCVRDCPYDTLRLARSGDGPAIGTPYFIARDIPCEMCDDIPCAKACPTGALSHDLAKIEDAKMGVASLVGRETCLNMLGLRCDVCYRVCPVIDKAITLERSHNTRTNKHAIFEPVVHAEHCTGCGKCEKSCVLDVAAIKVLPVKLAQGRADEHYRFGWEEKEKAGQEVGPGVFDLPDRVPRPALSKPPGGPE